MMLDQRTREVTSQLVGRDTIPAKRAGERANRSEWVNTVARTPSKPAHVDVDANADADVNANADVESMSFEQAQAELEQVVERLEDQHTGLDEALGLWERGEALHAFCQRKLDAAAARIERLQVTADDAAAVVAEGGDDFAPDEPVAPSIF